MDNYIGPITSGIIDKIIKEIKKKETKEKIMINIIDPLLKDLSTRYYPHFMVITIILIVIVVMLLAILCVVLLNRNV
jgi:hypothetical protein